ncbi:UPF0016 family membrane protein [Betaproteobacteria bacterium]|nr:UPF0016 family membrane protein [Betaproteobacteria bacterium]GHT99007.1 UPF0016 family membrane protein [Betaproteobacteria bacterium]GHU02191.1 UPF0016 family membrane protein [Betaproteobacteria bacterium]GHU12749.1 UPF0016 family membrane protein [Betaproteobacteria bacterium]GHU23798.1 UPF0016 family membrane protein [Betaproteobacteria bacterium]
MDSFLIPAGIVALAEIGDKTQLLAFVLGARYKKSLPVILGIAVATLANHGLAGGVGALVIATVPPEVLRWVLALSFFAMAAWTLIPDKIDDDETRTTSHRGVFITTLVAFFLAEMGDKTQIATVALTAHYASPLWVISGTIVGMLIADVPAVLIGDRFGAKLPVRAIHVVSAVLFALLGLATLQGWGSSIAN